MKYKVGDKVRVKKLMTQEEFEEMDLISSCGFDDDYFEDSKMAKLFGKIVTIKFVADDGSYLIKEDDNGFWWDDCMFDGLADRARNRGFEIVNEGSKKNKGIDITLPTRGTQYSAGYDFYSPIDIEIQPHDKVCIWSDVKAYMQEGEVLLLYVRSSIGIKKGLRLSNGTGVIDSDYYSNPDNDGNIGLSLYNYTNEVVKIKKGERICQGVFIPFLVADNGNTYNSRTGGIGSTNE